MGYTIRLTKENIDFVKSIVESAEYNAELNRDSDLGTEIGKLWHAIYGYRSDYDTFFAIGTTIMFLLIQLRENRPHEDIASCLYETSVLAEEPRNQELKSGSIPLWHDLGYRGF